MSFRRILRCLRLAASFSFFFVALTSLAAVKVKVASKKFTENQILATITALHLEAEGFDVETRYNAGLDHGPRDLQKEGKVDLYWEYTGTAYQLYQGGKDSKLRANAPALYEKVRSDDEKQGLVWLGRTEINNTYVIMMRLDEAKKNGLKTLSDFSKWLSKQTPELPFVSLASFYNRPDGFKNLSKTYQLQIPRERIRVIRSYSKAYRMVRDRRAFAAVGFSTNPQIAEYGLVALEDDLSFFPVYNPSPVIRSELLDRLPRLRGVIQKLTSHLSQEDLIHLNGAVDLRHKDIQQVSRQWLKDKGLKVPK